MFKNTFLIILILLFSITIFSQRTAGEYTIQILDVNSDKSDFGASYYGENSIIFASSRSKTAKKWDNNQSILDLYECEVTGEGKTRGFKKFASNVNSQDHESSVSFAPDGKSVYFTRNNSDLGEELVVQDSTTQKKKHRRTRKKNKKKTSSSKKNMAFLAIYRADVIDGKWENITSLPFNNINYSVAHPSVNRDGSKLYFSSGASGFGLSDIFVVDILENDEYSEPKNLGKKINTSGRDNFPFIDSKNILYFSSDSRVKGVGALDIYAAQIYDDGTISDVLHLPEPINTVEDDFSYIINHDKDEGYFSSNRVEGGVGDDDIYYFYADIPLSFECAQQVTGIAKNAKNSKALPNTLIAIYSNKKLVKEIKTDDEGRFKISLRCDAKFELYASKSKFDNDEQSLKTSGNYSKKHSVTFKLAPIICNQVVKGTVVDSKDGTPIAKALVTIYNAAGKRVEKTKTDSRGKFNVDVTCSSKYKITAIKKEYSKAEDFFTTTDNSKESQTLSLKIAKIICNKTVSGVVTNNDTKQPLQSANLVVFNEDNVEVAKTTSDENGNYSLLLDCKNRYIIKAMKDGFVTDEISFKVKKANVMFDFSLNIKIEEVIKVRDKIIVNINPIYFELDQHRIIKDATVELEKVVAIMRKYPTLRIEAGSHTDSRGPAAYNIKLSSKRASSTVNYITSKGIDASRITSKGYGEALPTNRCVEGVRCTKEEYQQNRRTEFVILNPEVINF